METEHVILVDEMDNELGTMEKVAAHKKGELHRAISVFVFNSQKQLLLQKRATHKYHSGGLWTNSCCSHPRKNETTQEAAQRRLMEEMGLRCIVKPVSKIKYTTMVGNNMLENELDHIFVGFSDDVPAYNPLEVSTYKYMHMDDIEKWMHDEPARFTEWFKILFEPVKNDLLWKKYL